MCWKTSWPTATSTLASRSEERRAWKGWRYWRGWSSDVCSSDLRRAAGQREHALAQQGSLPVDARVVGDDERRPPARQEHAPDLADVAERDRRVGDVLEDVVADRDVDAGVPIGRASCMERVEILAGLEFRRVLFRSAARGRPARARARAAGVVAGGRARRWRRRTPPTRPARARARSRGRSRA